MVCALFVGTVWLIITSKMGLNVSSTHSISRLTHGLHAKKHCHTKLGYP